MPSLVRDLIIPVTKPLRKVGCPETEKNELTEVDRFIGKAREARTS